MNYKVYKLTFQGAVHFGKLNLEDGEYTCCADTIFSALCHEALQIGTDVLQQFYQYAKTGALLLSDAFPYMEDTLFLPKPMKHIESEGNQGNSTIKKAYKKLKYIPMDSIETYLLGKYDILNAPSAEINQLGYFDMKTAASIRGEEQTTPYRIGTYYYNKGNGLYIIAGIQEEKASTLLEELLEHLSFSGIGGKRASGFGKFKYSIEKLPSKFCKRLENTSTRYMSLSVSLPKENELATALDGAEYLLCKRSGFVASEQYASKQMRKRDLYVMKAGSCFRSRFQGDIYDVSQQEGAHPVYRYAKPIFMEVDA